METTNNITIAPVKRTAVMCRRDMAKIPAVMDALEPVERAVFIASTAKTIAEHTGSELAAELTTTLKFIARDIGYRDTDQANTQYLVIRVAEILKRYYRDMTLNDFRMAFEMCITGELDGYLPRGRDGQPDRNHYQQFNAEYICKILNAYRSRRGGVMRKAILAIPKKEIPTTLEQREYYERECRKDYINAFYYYKYHGRLPYLSPIGEMLCYQMLSDAGLADEIVVTLAEQRIILQRTINAFIGKGYIADAESLRKEGVASKEIKHDSFALARRKALERTFAWMVEQEIQITDYVKV